MDKTGTQREREERLRKAGWESGDFQDFLGLTDEETAIIKIRLALARALRQRRKGRKMSQARFAERIGSSQSRVAKMEAGDPSVSFDLLLRSLIHAGSTSAELGEVIASVGDPTRSR